MLGLPTETDEDVLGIAELAYKIIRVWKETASNKKRGLSINLSTAYFVPKPFTPFQWVEQISPEEYLRRVHLLKDAIRSKSIDYRYHESDLSRLEAVLARGDRRLSPVLEQAVENGARLDGWDEYFDYDAWLRAFDACGVDPADYCRRYDVNEVLPWDTISVGVSRSFFRKEYEKACRGETTPDCRQGCNGCGANRLGREGKCDE